MKGSLNLLLFLFFVTVLLSGCGRGSTVPDLRETFRYSDDKLNGGSFAYKMLANKYRGNGIDKIDNDFTYINSMHTDGHALYYCTSSNILMSEDEADNLSSYVKAGNTVFLASKYFDSTLLKLFFTSAENNKPLAYELPYSFDEYKTELVRYGDAQFDTSFSYYYLPFKNHFNEVNHTNYKVLGLNGKGLPNFIVFFWGKGKLFLHCDPAALSNYFLMANNNYKYFEKLLSYLPEAPEQIYLDDFYCNRNYKEGDDDASLLRMIYERPALAWAFSILLGSFLIYVLINLKREQRIMPVRNPVKNDSVNFVEAITALYYKKKNNKNIADKMINYFYDDLRSTYFITNTQMNNDLVATLSHKSGMDIEETKQLFYCIKMVQDSEIIDEEQLKELNRLIYKFKHIK